MKYFWLFIIIIFTTCQHINAFLWDPKTVEKKLEIDYPYSLLKDINEVYQPTDTSFFWHIPKSGGSSLKHIIGHCLAKVSASNDAEYFCGNPAEENELRLCFTDFGAFVNVNNGDVEGIRKSQNFGLIPSGLADVIVSTNFQLTSFLFSDEFGGRAFAIFRHPVDRIVSTFYYLGKATWEPNYNEEFASMNILDYARSETCPTNWLTRNILGNLDHVDVVLTERDIQKAKKIIKRKIFILMFDDYISSIGQLFHYLGWHTSDPDVRNCIENDTNSKSNKGEYTKLEVGSEAWNLIAKRNLHDIELFHYARELYTAQKKKYSAI